MRSSLEAAYTRLVFLDTHERQNQDLELHSFEKGRDPRTKYLPFGLEKSGHSLHDVKLLLLVLHLRASYSKRSPSPDHVSGAIVQNARNRLQSVAQFAIVTAFSPVLTTMRISQHSLVSR